MNPTLGWQVSVVPAKGEPRIPGSINEVHNVPLNDLRRHELSPGCWCLPEEDVVALGLWRHNSADGREHTFEQGRLQ